MIAWIFLPWTPTIWIVWHPTLATWQSISSLQQGVIFLTDKNCTNEEIPMEIPMEFWPYLKGCLIIRCGQVWRPNICDLITPKFDGCPGSSAADPFAIIQSDTNIPTANVVVYGLPIFHDKLSFSLLKLAQTLNKWPEATEWREAQPPPFVGAIYHPCFACRPV